MISSIRTIGLRLADQAGAWFRRGRYQLLGLIAYLSNYKFTCRIQRFMDETQPVRRDQFFRVQMAGRILTPRDHVDTDIKVTILDVTAGQSKAELVFSADETWRGEQSPEFESVYHHGIIVEKDSILDHWVTVVQFPCHILRLAYRGRRKLLFCVTVLEKEIGQELVSCRRTVEYVYCTDGYRDLHGRRLDVLRGCLQLTVIAVDTQVLPDGIKHLMTEWIRHKPETYVSPEDLRKTLTEIQNGEDPFTIENACEAILAFGEETDRFCALELALQSVSLLDVVTRKNLDCLSQVAKNLKIPQPRFLRLAQKVLLSSNCSIEDPSQLLGISSTMDADAFRKRLNEEYRKWNARVTHPDPQIRAQADQMLNLVAEIRSRWLQPSS